MTPQPGYARACQGATGVSLSVASDGYADLSEAAPDIRGIKVGVTI